MLDVRRCEVCEEPMPLSWAAARKTCGGLCAQSLHSMRQRERGRRAYWKRVAAKDLRDRGVV